MRAAADYMMGRYRDAHNDLAGAVLRCRSPCRSVARPDRSGAGKLGTGAHLSGTGRTGAEAAIQPDWQARARLADAEAALGMGRLELADAAHDAAAARLSTRTTRWRPS